MLAPWVGMAQSLSLPLGSQNQPVQNIQPLGSLSMPNLSTQSSTISSTASGASPPPGATIPSSQGKAFGTVGAGLPGMTGGPPLTSGLGALDPASGYRPPSVIEPLFCDPSVNIPCQ